MNFELVAMSFGVGLLIGISGMGGAALMAPFLILVMGLKPVTAVGTDLVYGAVTKIVGAWIHLKQGTVDVPVVRRLAMGSIPAGLLGAFLVTALPQYTPHADHYIKRVIGSLLVLVAVVLVGRFAIPRGTAPSARKLRWLEEHGTVIWGATVGFCVGATSVGSGSLLAPFLMMLYPSRTSRVVGTDLCHAAILVTATGFVHSISGQVEWHLVPFLLAGALPGVTLGSKLATWIPSRVLRTGLAAVLLATGVRMF